MSEETEPLETARTRLDTLLVRRGFAASRARARRLVEAGAVHVDGRQATKAGRTVRDGAELMVTEPDIPYVSRAGLKLEAALDRFELDPAGARVLDVGASTGGFTDLLLQRGAREAVTVDVGTDQLHPRLRSDPRVRCLEGTDIREADRALLDAPFSWLVADLSFLSLGAVLPALRGLVEMDAVVAVLVKPQFEVGRGKVSRGGVVRDSSLREGALERVRGEAARSGFRSGAAFEVPLPGESGNREYFLRLHPVAAPEAKTPRREGN
ncbi:TlyA family RNA methyltransferase [Thiohalorhabdus sp. Cl-TMA]|uniref:TlyA family RNA methyltransferase n=1 Tax=Thiohalorhabdus methylotrophus TaxID=3242694 RepID=A0ABV4TY71_9GAMM